MTDAGPVTSVADAPGEEQAVCATCSTPYRPILTLGECPVCGTPAPGEFEVPRPLDNDTRITVLVVGSMVANLLILAVLGILYLNS